MIELHPEFLIKNGEKQFELEEQTIIVYRVKHRSKAYE